MVVLRVPTNPAFAARNNPVFDVVEQTGVMVKQLSFSVAGAPPIQQRPRITYRGRESVIMYDPTAAQKTIFKNNLREALQGYTFPYFTEAEIMASAGVKLIITFFVKHRYDDYHVANGNRVLRADYCRIPSNKDVDNMLKFVMDALAGVIYHNDFVVVEAVAKKSFVAPDSEYADGYTNISVEKLF